MAKKKLWYCGNCGNPCKIYKRGKKHRVLVCPKCEVIASNPLPIGLLASAIAPSLFKGALSVGKKILKKGEGEEKAPVSPQPFKPSLSPKNYLYNIYKLEKALK